MGTDVDYIIMSPVARPLEAGRSGRASSTSTVPTVRLLNNLHTDTVSSLQWASGPPFVLMVLVCRACAQSNA